MKSPKKIETTKQDDSGVSINPLSIYTAADCRTILGVSRNTLAKFVSQSGFPLRPINEGRALGQDIIDWLKSQPIRSTLKPRGRAVHKTSHKKTVATN